jgi:hypothetical protein
MNTNRKIYKLAEKIILNKCDWIEGIRQLEALLNDIEFKNEDLELSIKNISDDIEVIPRGQERKICSNKFIYDMNKREKELFKFHQNEIERICKSLMNLYKNQERPK